MSKPPPQRGGASFQRQWRKVQAPLQYPQQLPCITGITGGPHGYFVDQFGNPRLVWGDAVWGLCGNVGRWSSNTWRQDYDAYLSTRQRQGITVVYGKPMGTTQNLGVDDNGGTFDGLYPFQGTTPLTGQAGANPSTGLTEAYWARIDYFLAAAKARGITWFCNAIGYNSDFDGGPGPLAGKAQSEFQAYGTALGNRYKTQPNLVWTIADDYFGDVDNLLDGFKTGLAAGGDTHVITVENFPETTSRHVYSRTDAGCVTVNGNATVTDSQVTSPISQNDVGAFVVGAGIPAGAVIVSVTNGASFVMDQQATASATVSLAINNSRAAWGYTNAQYNFVYSYEVIYWGVEKAYTDDGTVPVIAGDGYFYQGGSTYQGGTSFAFDRNFRQEAWWALSSGARGKISGDEGTWQWQSTAQNQADTGWFWANSALAIRTAFEALPGWQNLLPDTNSRFIIAGRGTHASYTTTQYESATTDAYVTGSITPDGSLAVVYLSHGSTITINESLLAPGYTATWIDPVNGATSSAGTGTTYNSTAKGNNSQGDPDWVLAFTGNPLIVPGPGEQIGGRTYRRRWLKPQEPGGLTPAVSPDLQVNAGLATGIGAALDAPTENDASGTGAAGGTGSAQSPGLGLAGGSANSTGASQGPGIELTPGASAGTGAAFGPGLGLQGGSATSTGVSSGPGVDLTPGIASGFGAGQSSSAEDDVTPGLATGTGTALNATAQQSALPGSAAQPGGWSFRRRWRRSQERVVQAPASVIVSPPLIASGFGAFSQVPANSVILAIIANVTQHGSSAAVTAPSYELWDGVTAIIGSPVTGTASTSAANVDSVVFTGVSYSQLGTLQLRVYGSALAGNPGATVSVDAVSLSVEWAPNQDATVTPDVLAVTPVIPAPAVSVGVIVSASTLAVVPALPAASAGFLTATVFPDALAVSPVIPPVTVSTGMTVTPGVLAVTPAFPAVADVTQANWATAEADGGWVNPQNVTGTPDGSTADWSEP